MLDAYKITDDTILRRLTTEGEIHLLHGFLTEQTQVICPQKPFSKDEFLKTFLPILGHPKLAVWAWLDEDTIIGAMVLAIKHRKIYAAGLSFHRKFDVINSIPQLIEDGRRLLALYGVNHIVFSVDPTSPHVDTFNEHFAVTASPPGAPPGSISYEISI